MHPSPSDRKSLLLFILVSLLFGACATQEPVQEDRQQQEVTPDTVEQAPSWTPPGRPIPNALDEEIPPSFYRAVEAGTRTMTGSPGSGYWTQESDYEIDVELHPNEKRLTGTTTIRYHNNSPDTLSLLALELAQNVHREGALRNEGAEITEGIRIDSLSVEGSPATESRQYYQALRSNRTSYYIEGTLMVVHPASPVMPESTVELHLTWEMEIPQAGAGGRMGYSQDNLFFLAYWYPKMRVYDDVIGWFTDPFRLNAEFYHDFGDYDVSITVPEQWVVSATGELANPREVLLSPIANRLEMARGSDRVVTIVGESDFGNVTPSPADQKITWRFRAEQVRDFAFSVTDESVWDATRAPVGDLDGDGQTDHTTVHAFYRSSAPMWNNVARFSQHAISFLSDYTGMPYPWPHMTAVEGGGIIGGGMEFPMMTIMGTYNGQPASALYAVTAHELAHMWVPMLISTNERRYSWIDEGTTTFNEDAAKEDFYPDRRFGLETFQSYLNIAGTGMEGPVMRWSDFHYNPAAFGVASYPKPASILMALRGVLGEETFTKAYHTFLDRWQYKHPYPWDMFNTFEDIAGRDLDWFWRSWYFETWVLDQAVAEVESGEDGVTIRIEDRGEVPMPVHLQITYADRTTENRTIPEGWWLSGETSHTITVSGDREVVRVEIDPEFLFPDVDRTNNRWER